MTDAQVEAVKNAIMKADPTLPFRVGPYYAEIYARAALAAARAGAETDNNRIAELEERIAELYRAQKSQILSARSFEPDVLAARAEGFAAGIEAAHDLVRRWPERGDYDKAIEEHCDALSDAIRALRPAETAESESGCCNCGRPYERESKDFKLCCICERDLIATRVVGDHWATKLASPPPSVFKYP